MRKVKIEDLRKGDLIIVNWIDASNEKARLEEHETSPELHVKDWGLFLGISGRKHQFIIVGKDVTEAKNAWGATRIPLELVSEVILWIPREQVALLIDEVRTIGRRFRLRRHRREDYYIVRVA